MRTLCQMDEHGFSCFGCCGHDYKSKKVILNDIKKNTLQHKNFKGDVKKHMDKNEDVRASGICKFVVFLKKNKVGCPFHPALNRGKDIRKGHCDIKHMCTANERFMKWPKSKQEKFIKFIKSKNPDVYDYSMGLDDDSYIKEFEENN